MKIKVLKNSDNIFILDLYSKKYNLLLKIGLGKRNRQINFLSTHLVPAEKQLTPDLSKQGKLIHDCGDDSTPWTINNTCIGANHGLYGGILIDSPGHGLTTKETGIQLSDLNGNKFYVIKIIGSRRFWILGENSGADGMWNLNQKLIGSTLKNPAGGKIKIKNKEIIQIGPTCRIKDQKFFINGKTPLVDGKIMKCDFLDISEEYDILAPDSLLENLKKKAGRKLDFIAENIESVITNKIRYRFMPYGACTIQHNSTARRDFELERMGFIQTARLYRDKDSIREYYIPKTLPFKSDGCEFNFESIQKISGEIPSNYFSTQDKNISDPMNLPDRFIQFLSKDKKREVGYAVGYSLIKGMSRPEIRTKNCSRPLCIYFTKKIYPFAIDKKMGLIKKGTTFDVLGYRQYFNPELNKDATAIYFHAQGDSIVIYMHFHKNIKNKLINLPNTLVGKKISVVEKTPSFKLLTTNKVAAEGIKVSVSDNYGYAVLKLD